MSRSLKSKKQSYKTELPSRLRNKSIQDSQNQSENQNQQIIQQNNRLRYQLLQLSKQLDRVLQRAATHKMKVSISPVIASTKQSKQKELQNALKIIERLKKTIKDFQQKEAYEVSFKRVHDLQEIVKKKQIQLQQLRGKIRKHNKILKDKQKNVSQLLQQQEVAVNVNQNKQKIQQLKDKIGKLAKSNNELAKKSLQKQQKLFTAERKMQELEWVDQKQIGRSQQLLHQLEKIKNKYKQTMNLVEKQNAQIIKLNLEISKNQLNQKKRRPPKSYGYQQSPRKISKSVQQLPSINKSRAATSILNDLPALPKRY